MKADLWVWNEKDEQPPSPSLAAWRAAGIDTIYLKCGDGTYVWDQFARELPALHALGFKVWAWQYVYGAGNETGPAIAAMDAGADGFIIDAEGEWERSASVSPSAYVAAIRAVSNKPIYLSSFGQPHLHGGMRWSIWDTIIDGYIPQVFPDAWGLTIADAITRMYQSHSGLSLIQPIYPAAYLYPQANPVVNGADVAEFLGQAQAGGYERVSFWRDGIMGQDCVDALSAFLALPPAPPTPAPGAALEERVARIESYLGATFKGWPPPA